MTKRFAALAAVAYLLLASIYLIYWRHVEYFIDDWFLLRHFRQAVGQGPRGLAGFVAAAAENRIYGVFRMQWLSILWGFLVTLLGGYAAPFNFALLLLLHVACCWLLCQALWRLGLDPGRSFLAGALYLLAPTAHFALFTYLTNPFFVFSTFWVLLLLWWFGGGGPVLPLSLFAIAGLFSGEQTFLLLWAGLPLAAWCFGRRKALPALAAIWGALALAGGAYLLWINRVAVHQSGTGRRYAWTWSQLQANVLLMAREWWGLNGLTGDALFHLDPQGTDLAVAVAAALLVAALVWRWRGGETSTISFWQVAAFAAAGLALAFGLVLWTVGYYERFRYYYVPSPFVGAGLAACCALLRRPRFGPALLGGLATGFLVLNAAADLRQCWIPQSDHQRTLRAALAEVRDVAPGDLFIISETPYIIGTAQHFTMHSAVSANPFAEWVTGVAPLEVGHDLLYQHGNLVLAQRLEKPRHVSLAELAHAHVLVASDSGRFSSRQFVAQEVHPGRFLLIPLKGSSLPAGTEHTTFMREQLALVEGQIYFPKSSSP